MRALVPGARDQEADGERDQASSGRSRDGSSFRVSGSPSRPCWRSNRTPRGRNPLKRSTLEALPGAPRGRERRERGRPAAGHPAHNPRDRGPADRPDDRPRAGERAESGIQRRPDAHSRGRRHAAARRGVFLAVDQPRPQLRLAHRQLAAVERQHPFGEPIGVLRGRGCQRGRGGHGQHSGRVLQRQRRSRVLCLPGQQTDGPSARVRIDRRAQPGVPPGHLGLQRAAPSRGQTGGANPGSGRGEGHRAAHGRFLRDGAGPGRRRESGRHPARPPRGRYPGRRGRDPGRFGQSLPLAESRSVDSPSSHRRRRRSPAAGPRSHPG